MDLKALMDNLFIFLSRDWKLLAIMTSIFGVYYYYTANFDFFKKRGIPYMKPVILFGTLGPRIRGKRSFHDFQVDVYNYFKGKPIGGVFEGRRPAYYILDPDLIKAITIRDSDHFVDRYTLITNEPPYLKKSLLNLKGAEWKGVRSAMTPVFSSARLKNMIPLLELCSKQMVEYLKQCDQKEVEMKDAMGHYTLETIGACAFGIKSDALSSGDSHFVKVAEKFDYMPLLKRIKVFTMLLFMPKLLRYIRFSFLNEDAAEELVRILQAAKAERRMTHSEKSDFLQILIDVANKEQAHLDKNAIKYMDDDTIDAQCLLFLLAGYETSSTLLSFAVHSLAIFPEIQEKLRAYIIEKTEGKELSYELLAELHYLEAVLLETLRMYAPIGRMDRVVTKPYKLNNNVQLNVGEVVVIPIHGIHMDPDIYPEPREFRPERFMGEEKKQRPAHMYLAFGAGPRNCIGLRFGMISAKLAMVHLLKKFKFTKCPRTEYPVSFDLRSLLLKPKNGLWVKVENL